MENKKNEITTENWDDVLTETTNWRPISLRVLEESACVEAIRDLCGGRLVPAAEMRKRAQLHYLPSGKRILYWDGKPLLAIEQQDAFGLVKKNGLTDDSLFLEDRVLFGYPNLLTTRLDGYEAPQWVREWDAFIKEGGAQ